MKAQLIAGLLGLACILSAWGISSATAQGLFSPVVIVNDRLVTRHQLDQRTQFLTLLGVPENQREVALNQLSIEALQLGASEAAGFQPTPEAIAAGQSEFASRANLSREQFIAALGQAGVQPETFIDFISAGVAWRGYVQERFRTQAEALQPGALDRALESAELAPTKRVLLSEIILPANTDDARRVSLARAQGFSQLTSPEQFGVAAGQFSVANTRFRAGEVEWRPLAALPPEIVEAVDPLQPGQASRPIELDNAVAVFFLRDVEIAPATTAQFASVDYASLQLPAGSDAQAQRIAARIDRCEDLEAESVAYSEAAYARNTTLLTALPADIRGVIDGLDAGEASIALRRGSAPVVVILCRRTFGEGAEIDPSLISLGLVNQRLQLLANRHLRELRDAAVVIRPDEEG